MVRNTNQLGSNTLNLKSHKSLTGTETYFKKLAESDIDYKSHVKNYLILIKKKTVVLSDSISTHAFEMRRSREETKYDLLICLSS